MKLPESVLLPLACYGVYTSRFENLQMRNAWRLLSAGVATARLGLAEASVIPASSSPCRNHFRLLAAHAEVYNMTTERPPVEDLLKIPLPSYHSAWPWLPPRAAPSRIKTAAGPSPSWRA